MILSDIVVKTKNANAQVSKILEKNIPDIEISDEKNIKKDQNKSKNNNLFLFCKIIKQSYKIDKENMLFSKFVANKNDDAVTEENGIIEKIGTDFMTMRLSTDTSKANGIYTLNRKTLEFISNSDGDLGCIAKSTLKEIINPLNQHLENLRENNLF